MKGKHDSYKEARLLDPVVATTALLMAEAAGTTPLHLHLTMAAAAALRQTMVEVGVMKLLHLLQKTTTTRLPETVHRTMGAIRLLQGPPTVPMDRVTDRVDPMTDPVDQTTDLEDPTTDLGDPTMDLVGHLAANQCLAVEMEMIARYCHPHRLQSWAMDRPRVKAMDLLQVKEAVLVHAVEQMKTARYRLLQYQEMVVLLLLVKEMALLRRGREMAWSHAVETKVKIVTCLHHQVPNAPTVKNASVHHPAQTGPHLEVA